MLNIDWTPLSATSSSKLEIDGHRQQQQHSTEREEKDRQERSVNMNTNNTQYPLSHQQWKRPANVTVYR